MKNTTQHTPGPWSYSGIAGDNHIMARTKGGRQAIAGVYTGDGIADAERDANLRLIAAAPDLREATNAMLRCHDYGKSTSREEWSAAANLARSALAHATTS